MIGAADDGGGLTPYIFALHQLVMKATITSKGQITLPANLRHKHGWVQGTVLEFSEDASTIVVSEAVRRRSAQAVIGCLKADLNKSVEEHLADLRGEVELPPRT